MSQTLIELEKFKKLMKSSALLKYLRYKGYDKAQESYKGIEKSIEEAIKHRKKRSSI